MGNFIKVNLTVEDIKENVLAIEKEISDFSESRKAEIFKTYDKVHSIYKHLHDLENLEKGHYDFDSCGDLIYNVQISNEIIDLPYIKEYLTQENTYINKEISTKKEIYLKTYCGPYIVVIENPVKLQAFVYENGKNDCIIFNKASWMDDTYVSAVIEKYQQERGEFYDIVIVSSYGGEYLSHFEISKNVMDNYQSIVDSYKAKYVFDKED
jgi:hypothetical protein